MLRKVSFILASFLCLSFFGTSLSAQSETAPSVSSDTTAIIGVTDSLAAALQGAFVDTTAVEKVRDRGFDATRYKMMKRYTPKDHHAFKNEFFSDNTFYSVRAATQKLGTVDYPFGLVAGFSFGKWLHEDHALRLNISLGHWSDNFNGAHIHTAEASVSYLFNVTSYLGGYKPTRFCNLSVVVGGGYANTGYEGVGGQAGTIHAGLNVDMKLSQFMTFFVEPLAKAYSNGMAISRAGNWRSWLSAFEGSLGMSFTTPVEEVVLPTRKWFLTTVFGTQLQNSFNVYEEMGILNSLGAHINLGAGHYVTDYMAFRGTLSYSRHKWVQYDEVFLYSNYFALRVEAMLDLVAAFDKNKDRPAVSVVLLLGPELGYMHKDDYGEEYLAAPYMGLAGGLQLKFALGKKVRMFLEPHCSLVPYNGISYDKTTLNDYINYYDGLINMSLGLEIDL